LISEFLARYQAGEDTPLLSRENAISNTGTVQLLPDESVALRRRPKTLEDGKRAVRLNDSGLTIDEVVKPFSYSYITIQRTLHQRRVMMRAGPLVETRITDA